MFKSDDFFSLILGHKWLPAEYFKRVTPIRTQYLIFRVDDELPEGLVHVRIEESEIVEARFPAEQVFDHVTVQRQRTQLVLETNETTASALTLMVSFLEKNRML